MYGKECTFHFSAESKLIMASTNRFINLIENECISANFEPYKWLVRFYIRDLDLDGQIVNFSH